MIKEKMKVIFLDFDGVITTLESKWRIDIEKVRLVERLCDDTDAKIVVSSTWRAGHENAESFKNELVRKLGDNAKTCEKFLGRIVGLTDRSGSCRGDEVGEYLDSHRDIEEYVIIDDDSDFLDEQLFNFVQTDYIEGITEREVKLCRQVLNGERIQNPIRLNCELRYLWRLEHSIPRTSNPIDRLYMGYLKKFQN